MNNRIFKKIRNKYESYFRVSPKVNSAKGKFSKILKEETYEDYIKAVLEDNDIDIQTKALIGLLCSTGLRISEVLHIKVNQLNFEALRVERVLILKKRIREMRLTKPLHPVVIEFLKKFIEGKQGEDSVLSFDNRHQAFRRLDRYFGTGCHDYRHSFIAYFLSKNRHQGLERITAIQGWSSVSMAYTYSNVDTTKEIDNFFKMAG